MLDDETVPVPPATVQVCQGEVGCMPTVTVYPAPLATSVGNAKPPAAVMGSGVPPFRIRVSPVPEKPLTVPLTANASTLQLTVIDVTSEPMMVPALPVTEQVCVGWEGWVAT